MIKSMQNVFASIKNELWLGLANFLRRSLRFVQKRRKALARKTALSQRPEAQRGCYLLQGNRYQNGGLIITPSRTALAEVFLEVLGEMGGDVVVVMGEHLDMSRPLLSISPPVAAPWLQNLFANYSDVLKQNHGVELSVQSVEKCCSVVLTPDKHLVMRACEPARYIRALENRGLREVTELPSPSVKRQAQLARPNTSDESRLDELKQYLSVSSSLFTPRSEWLH